MLPFLKQFIINITSRGRKLHLHGKFSNLQLHWHSSLSQNHHTADKVGNTMEAMAKIHQENKQLRQSNATGLNV